MDFIEEFIEEQTADVGNRLKIVAKRVMKNAFIIAIILAVLEVIGGLISWIAVDDWTGIFIFVGGIVAAAVEIPVLIGIAQIIMLCLYAKGESVQLLHMIADEPNSAQPKADVILETKKTDKAKSVIPETKRTNTVKPVIPQGVETWKCQCENVNPAYLSTCNCGLSKRENKLRQASLDTTKE